MEVATLKPANSFKKKKIELKRQSEAPLNLDKQKTTTTDH